MSLLLRICRFRARTLLALMVAIAIPLGWKVNCVRAQRHAVEVITEAEGRIRYDCEKAYYEQWKLPLAEESFPGPLWLRQIVGNDFFAHVVEIWLDNAIGDQDALLVTSVPAMPYLTVVVAPRISDEGVAQLTKVPSLEYMMVGGRIRGDNLGDLATIATLSYLSLSSPDLTDAALLELRGCTQLKGLVIQQAERVTDKAIAELHQTLPLCHILCLRADETVRLDLKPGM